jgi:hypothetical protein
VHLLPDRDRVIWTEELRPGLRVQVTVSSYRGREYLDVREFWQPTMGEWAPTKKGIRVPIDLAESLADAIATAGEIVAA